MRNQRIYLSVVNDDDGNEDLRHLVGRRGEVLDALQELVRLSVLAASATVRVLFSILRVTVHNVENSSQK